MELDRKERLFLYNQYRILDKLCPNEGFDRHVEIVTNGFEGEYERLAFHIFDRGPSPQECRFVDDVMAMYQRLRWSYDDLSTEDKADIPAHTIAFRGFDRDHATMLMAYAQFLVDGGGSYPTIEERSDGPHIDPPTMARYRNMLNIWKLGLMETKGLLTKDEILALVNATYDTDSW